VGDKQSSFKPDKLAQTGGWRGNHPARRNHCHRGCRGRHQGQGRPGLLSPTVDYREKAAAAGKFPAVTSNAKAADREGNSHLPAHRRPIRPLFPKGWYNEVQVQTVVLSADGENDPDILSIIGASASLMVSDIPWAGPLGAVRVGRINGKSSPTRPTRTERERSRPGYVGNEKDIVMYEGAARKYPKPTSTPRSSSARNAAHR